MPLPAPFQAALAAKRTPCVLVKIVLVDGTTFTWTTYFKPVTWAGRIYNPNDYTKITPGSMSVGAEVPSFTIEGLLGSRISQDDAIYRWPNSRITFYVVFPILNASGDYVGDPTPGAYTYADGFLTTIQIVDPVTFTAEFESVQRGFNIAPVYDIPLKCPLTFGEGRCPVNAADFEHAVTLTHVSADQLTLKFTATPTVGFARGHFKPTSGGNNGLPKKGFKSASNVGSVWTCVLYDTFPFPLVITDTGVAREGCKKTKEDCDLFNPADVDHSAGWPYLGFNPPGQDWLTSNN